MFTRYHIATGLVLTLAPGCMAQQITAPQIKDGAVITPKIAMGAVTTERIANGAITDAKLAGDGASLAALRARLGLRLGLDVPTVGGTGATGTWGIDITGSAGSLSNGSSYWQYDPVFGWNTPDDVSATHFNGSGQYLTDLNPANITGQIPPAKGGAGGLTGLLKATSGTVSAATAGTDYLSPASPLDAAKLTGTIAVPSTSTAAGLESGTPNRSILYNATPDAWIVKGDVQTSGYVAAAGGVKVPAMNTLLKADADGSIVAAGAGDVPASALSGIVPVANLGTGTPTSSTYLRGDGAWTTSNWLTSASPLDASKLTGTASVNTTGTATNITGTVAVVNGGTGAGDAATARTNLGADNAANLTTGTLPDARLSSNIPRLNASTTFTSNLTAGGVVLWGPSGTTQGQLSYGSGAVSVEAASNSTAVWLRPRNATTFAPGLFVGTDGNVGIGTTSPTYVLHVAPTSGGTAGQTAFFKGSTDTGVVIKAGSAQAAKPWQYQNSGGTPLTYLTTGGDVVITDATKGTIRRSPNGHYWRTTVGDTGTLTTTDLGTTAP